MYQESDSDDDTGGIDAGDMGDDSKIKDPSPSGANLKECVDALSPNDGYLKECVDDEVDKSNISSSSNGDNDSKKEKSKAETIRDEIIEREDEEEYFLKNDAVGKFMFNYNKTTAMSNDLPEMNAPDAPVIISPGEGTFLRICFDYNINEIIHYM